MYSPRRDRSRQTSALLRPRTPTRCVAEQRFDQIGRRSVVIELPRRYRHPHASRRLAPTVGRALENIWRRCLRWWLDRLRHRASERQTQHHQNECQRCDASLHGKRCQRNHFLFAFTAKRVESTGCGDAVDAEERRVPERDSCHSDRIGETAVSSASNRLTSATSFCVGSA